MDSSTHRCCAERRLLRTCTQAAWRHGFSGLATSRWIKRKYGNTLVVWRFTANGSLGCSVPCCYCFRALSHLDLYVSYVKPDGTSCREAISNMSTKPKLTSMQKKVLQR